MKRWNKYSYEMQKSGKKDCEMTENKRIDNFLDEIVELCKKYNLVIEHEDSHGAFEISDLDKDEDFCWLREAYDGTKSESGKEYFEYELTDE